MDPAGRIKIRLLGDPISEIQEFGSLLSAKSTTVVSCCEHEVPKGCPEYGAERIVFK